MTAPAILTFLAACAWTQSQAQGPVILEAPASAMLGEPVTVRATTQLQPGETLTLDLERSTTESFAITEVKELSASSPQRTFQIQVVPLDVGRCHFPLFWSLAAGGSTRTLSAALDIEVSAPAQAAKAQDLKDIKPPARARPAIWPWLLLAAAILGLWYWNMKRALRRRELTATSGAPPDPRPPHIIAEEELSRLEASGLWAAGRHKEFYAELTDILRRYLERSCAFPATRLTTTEIYRLLRRREIERRLVTVFKDLFERADLVKFAKIPAQTNWGASDISGARRLVRDNSPQELVPTAMSAAAPEAKP